MAVTTDKSVFYHIPKTGGVFVKESMRASGLKYGRCRNKKVNHYLKREHSCPSTTMQEDVEGKFSFCFVRKPVDWYVSFWCFRIMSQTVDLRFPADRCWDMVFERFVVNILERYPNGFVTQLYKEYVGELADQIDFIGLQENLREDLIKALTTAGEDFDPQVIRNVRKRNVAAGQHKYGSRAVMSKRTREWLLDTERWIIKTFYD